MSLLDPVRLRLLDAGSEADTRSAMAAPLSEAPLSPGQERLWFLLRALPDAASYNMAVTIRLPDWISPALARAAWDLLVDRHAALRTLITETDGGPRQRLAADPASRPSWDVVDLVADGRRSPEDVMAELTREPFVGFGERVPARAALLLLPGGGRLVALTMHHILSDGWSMHVLRSDLVELANALSVGRAPRLEPLTSDHFEYAVRARARAESDQIARDRAWWQQHLDGLEGPLDLPTDMPRDSGAGQHGASLPILVPLSRVAGLRALCQEADTSLFVGILAVLGLLLHRMTGSEDIPVGTPRAQRAPREENIVGFCVETLLLRLRVKPGSSFRELLRTTADLVQASFEHEHVPFELVVADQVRERRQGQNPLFETMVALQTVPVSQVAAAGPVPDVMRECAARFELSLYFTEVSEGLLGSIEFRSDLFTERRIRFLRDQIGALWDAALATPDTNVSGLSMCGADEITHRETVSAGPARAFRPLTEVLAGQLAAGGDRTALWWQGAQLSYAGLAALVAAWQSGLTAAGLGRGDRAVVALGRGPDGVAALLACLFERVAYVPVDLRDPDDRLAAITEASGARGVLCEGALPWYGERALVRRREDAAPCHPVTGHPDDTAYVMYTSGSTGTPKGAALPHRTLDNLIGWQLGEFRAPHDAVTLQFAPLGFDVSIQEIASTLAGGGTLVLVDEELRRDPAALLTHCRFHGVERVFLPPLMLRELAAVLDRRGEFARFREVICAGEALIVPPAMNRLVAPDGVLVNQYGPAETHVVTAHVLEGDPATWPITPPIGTPIANVTLAVLDAWGNPAPLGSPGELVISGPAVGLGYISGAPEPNTFRAPMVAGTAVPVYASGDQVSQATDGTLSYLGRRDRQVKVRGFRVEPGEVEASLERLAGIRTAAVDAVLRPSGDLMLAAWVETDQHEDWRARLAGKLPRHLVPDVVIEMAKLPRTRSGKVDRSRLQLAGQPAPDPSLRTAALDGSASVRAVVQESCEQLLGVALSGDDAGFFALGGDSLTAMRLASRLETRLGVQVSVRDVFDHPALSDLAALLESRGAVGAADTPTSVAGDPVDAAGSHPATSGQAGLWFLGQLEPGDPAYHLTLELDLPRGTRTVAVQAALNMLASRHPSLRTSLRLQDGVLLQVVHRSFAIPLHEVRLPGGTAREGDEFVRRLTGDEMRTPFEPDEVLVRALLLYRDNAPARLVLTLHHAVADGWSLDIVRDELEALLSGRPLGPPPMSFAEWSVSASARGTADDELYWTRELAGANVVLDVPLDSVRGVQRNSAGTARAAALDHDTSARLRSLAGAAGTTPFAAVLAITSVLLGRLARSEDLLIGVPMANRGAGLDRTVGYLANSVVVRTRPRPGALFRELVREIGATLLDAQVHQAFPFEQVVRAVAPERSAGVHPLFQVMCSYDSGRATAPNQRVDVSGVNPGESRPTAAKYDLSFAFEAAADADGREIFLVGLEHRDDIIEPVTGAAWLAALTALARSAAAEPDSRVAELSAGHARPVDGSRPNRRPPADPTNLILGWARRQPTAPAVIDDRGELSYADLVRLAASLAAELGDVPPASMVGVLIRPGRDLVAAWTGVLLAGHTLVPLDPDLPAARLAEIERDAGLALVVVSASTSASVGVRRLPIPTQGCEPPPAPVVTSAPAYVLYTSGSTGRPKGVVVSRAALARYLTDTRELFGLLPSDHVLQFAAPGFDVAIEEIIGALAAGAAVVPRPPGPCPPRELIEHCADRGVTVLCVATSYFGVLARWSRIHELPSAIRFAVIGGEQLESAALTDWAATGVPVWNMYGPTEATISALGALLQTPERGRPPIGRPLRSARAYVLDQHLRPLPDYMPGELYLGGACLADGYLGDGGRAGVSRERPNNQQVSGPFCQDPFSVDPEARMYRTGDLAWIRQDGCLVYLGRVDDQVKVRGFRVELGAIEAVLRSSPEVGDTMVAVTAEQQIVAAVTATDERPQLDLDALRVLVRDRLPGYMVPASLTQLVNLPFTSSGKADRTRLAALVGSPTEDTSAPSGPGSPLGELWRSLLGRDPRPDDEFFASGGHSLLLLRLHAMIESEYGIRLGIKELMDASRFDAMTALVDGHQSVAADQAAPPPITSNPGTEAPATPAQSGVWYADHSSPGGYHLPLRLDYQETVIPGALATALEWLVTRHAALRTVFTSSAAGLVQRVLDPPASLLRYVDLSGNPRADVLLAQVLAADADRPFDLGAESPIRGVAVTLSSDHHVVQLTCHHIAVDGLSIDVMRRDFDRFYRTASRGRRTPPAPLVPSYLDYARRVAKRVPDPAMLARAEAILEGAELPTPLPFDRPPGPSRSSAGVVVAFALPEGFLSEVDRVVRATSTTRFAVLAGAWLAFVAELSGADDLVVGTPLANRPPEFADVVGCFVNVLPLRVQVGEDGSWHDLAKAVHERVGGLLEIQELALSQLVSRRRLTSSADERSTFDTCFVVQNADAGPTPQWASARPASTKFDLTLSMEVSADGVQGFLEARRSRLDDATAELWARWFCAYAESLARQPTVRLRDLTWTQPASVHFDDGGPNRSVPVVPAFLAHLAARPEAAAVTVGERSWSRAELAGLGASIVGELTTAGVTAGDRVALCMTDPVRRIAAELACLTLGAPFVPVEMGQPARRRARIIAAANAKVTLGDTASTSEPVPLRAVVHPPESPAYIMFTSGSTGEPKGVVVGHGALAAHVGSYLALFGLAEDDVCSHVASCGFDASIAEIMPTLAAGAAIAVPTAANLADVAETLAWLSAAAVSVAFLPTPVGELAFGEIERDPWREPATLRALYVGGSQLRRSPPAMRARVLNLYGPTEGTVASTSAELTSDAVGVPPIGLPLPGTRVRVVGPDGAPSPTGVAGELVIGGDKVALGYFGDAEKTMAAFGFEPGIGWSYRTGDLVRWRTDGRLDFLGRLDRQVQIRGVRVEPAEVEAALLRLPGVRQAYVAQTADATNEVNLIAWLAVASPRGQAARKAALRAELPAAMVPARVVELEALPLTPSGKIDAASLSERLLEVDSERVPPSDSPSSGSSESQDPLVAWWARCISELVGTAVDPDADFFSVGGHSLMATQALARGRDELGVDLRVADFLSAPTARGLAELSLDWAEAALGTPSPKPASYAGVPV